MKKMLRMCVTWTAIAVLTGCSSLEKDLKDQEERESQGIVRISFEQNEFESINLSESDAIKIATARCEVLGHKGKAFFYRFATKECTRTAGFMACADYLITQDYKCQGFIGQ